ncbi:flavodoxin domain-containing protein [Bacillus alkalicola]|uniref:Flavodoxin domain-containing protein n=1 Tax=Evansella alkalicola TaxID=745819 RepID=A0ABS6JXC9_9BACI|nr:flavodoxin domain-containing protein [Bacillus alkalicola]
MDSQKKVVIVYSSITGNTESLATEIYHYCTLFQQNVTMSNISDFTYHQLINADAVLVGTYTWGDGELPKEMLPLYRAFETMKRKTLVTGVFGTGDSFYPNFCGAVNEFRDMLYEKTSLAATLKVELLPQSTDSIRCEKFVQAVLRK